MYTVFTNSVDVTTVQKLKTNLSINTDNNSKSVLDNFDVLF